MPDPEALVARRAATLARTPAGALMLDNCDLAALADAHPTPFWVTGADTVRARAASLVAAYAPHGIPAARIHYAVKSNDHLAVLATVAACGLGADVVSGGELHRALLAGIPPDRIVFSGVGKTDDELRLALAERIGQINVESPDELDSLAHLARAAGHAPRVAVRVNPAIDAGTHTKISTGRAGDKFGLSPDATRAAFAAHGANPALRLRALAVHIGSQLLDPAPVAAAAARIAALAAELHAAGHPIDAVDGGGGLGIGYRLEPDADPARFAAALAEPFAGTGIALAVEPGRWLTGPAGVLVATVIRRKTDGGRTFLILDAAMNDLARPALYDGWHAIVPLRAHPGPLAPHDVAGPVCESSDVFARDRELPPLAAGEKVAILDTGAYGAAMSSTYNARPLLAHHVVRDGRAHLVTAAQPVAALWAGERFLP